MSSPGRPADEVATLVELERRASRRSRSEKASDVLLRGVGTLACVLAHVAVLVSWCILNLGLLPGIRPFDPFPFGILTLFVSSEGVLLCLLILISQNRMTREADHRARLTLQISLLAEKEVTKMLQMLHALGAAQGLRGVADDEEARRLSEPTDVAGLAEKLAETLKET
jgi:uncharacterized membrane protein